MVVRVENTLRLVNDSQPHSEGWWTWSVWVEGSPEDLADVQSVTYRLHPTFPSPVVHVTEASTNFRFSSAGWGEFRIAANVTLKDGRTVRLERWLDLKDAKHDRSAEKTGPTIFLSHSIADKDIVVALCDTLEKQGIQVFTAERIIDTGEETTPQVEKHLQQADAVVALFSDPPSRWVEQEALFAHKNGRYVVPVVLGDAKTTGKLSGLARFELSDVRYVDRLADQIAARVKDHAIPEEA